ncbi:MAG TPA: ribosome silencing factor [Anaerolineae bacterium]|nr:ribosome silencing factor [Anaerolineae bacterium]
MKETKKIKSNTRKIATQAKPIKRAGDSRKNTGPATTRIPSKQTASIKARASQKREVAPRGIVTAATSNRQLKQTADVKKSVKPQSAAKLIANPELDLANSIVAAISDKLGEKIVLIDVRPQSPFIDYFVICSANSERQIKAISDGVREHTLKHFNTKPHRIEGTADSGWVLMDYNGIAVHIFAPTQRQFYQLEDLWKEAPVVLKMQ